MSMIRAYRTKALVAAAIFAGLTGAACSEQAPPPPPPPSLNCLNVAGALLRDIDEGLTAEGTSLSSGAGHAAAAWERSFFVAAEIDGPALEAPGDVGVWFVTGLVEPGKQTIQSVSDLARRLSSFDEAKVGTTRVTSSAAGVAEARECLSKIGES